MRNGKRGTGNAERSRNDSLDCPRVRSVRSTIKCLLGPGPSAGRPTRGVANAHGAAAPARSARLNAPRMPTGPQPQNLLPVTTGHKRPQVLSPGAFRLSQRVTNCKRGLSPSAFRPSQLVQKPAGSRPQRVPPVTTGHKSLRPPSLGAFRRSRRVTRAHGNRSQTPAGPHTQRVPLVTAGHKSPRGLKPNAFRQSQRVTRAHGAHAQARSARRNGSQTPTGPHP